MAFLTEAANRGSISTGYDIDNSLKFEADNSEYMHYTCSGQTDYERMAYSVWLKRTELGTGQVFMEFGHGTANTSNLRIGFDSSDRLFCYGNSIVWRQTNRVFRDTSAWYHLFFLFDTTTPGGVSNNRIRIWVNGEMIDHGDFGVINNPGAGSAMGFNNSLNHSIGRQTEDATAYFCGYMAQVYASGGTPPVVGDFAETDDNGIWVPIDISEITPPDANGFNLDFSTSGSLGNDISSRNNDFTLVNIAAADQATDTPTNNFATLNPLHTTTKYTITEGGTNQVSSANGWGSSVGSVGVTSGKWYFEVQSADTNGYTLLGVIDEDSLLSIYINGDAHAGDAPYGITYYGGNGSIITDGQAVSGVSFPSWTTETMGCALDLDNNKIYFSKSGTYGNSGNPATGANGLSLPTGGSGTWFISTSTYYAASPAKTNQGGYTTNTISSAATDANGYGTFEYAPPTGYYALCTKNLAEYG
tara:strand:- start:1364 stop:2782 length:1419 start_codon:yes stop_codon:yes gene_type:complete